MCNPRHGHDRGGAHALRGHGGAHVLHGHGGAHALHGHGGAHAPHGHDDGAHVHAQLLPVHGESQQGPSSQGCPDLPL